MTVLRADAGRLPLRDESVDLIVTSPPYFAQRSYRDGGEHYDGQLGSEPHPQEFLEALWTVTAECWRVLKPTGSMWVNLGDKRSGSGAPGTTSGLTGRRSDGDPIPGQARIRDDMGAGVGPKIQGARAQMESYTRAAFGRAKSKMLLPHRYAEGCEDGYADPCMRDHEHVGRHPAYLPSEQCRGHGWIVRQDQVWSKPNGLPESVKDRTRDTHEFWFHLCKEGRYFAAVDEIREPHTGNSHPSGKNAAVTSWQSGAGEKHRTGRNDPELFDPRGKIPGSVWSIATEPLVVPEHIEVEHFAAFPSEWPRRLILGWSPSSICTACGTPRAPVVRKEYLSVGDKFTGGTPEAGRHKSGMRMGDGVNATITGYACACSDTSAPTRPAVVLDPFGGTGTTAMVARALGRTGISVDLSADYCRLARWRIHESPGASKVRTRTNREAQGVLL